MINGVTDTVLASVGKVLPQSVINGIGRVEEAAKMGAITLKKNTTYKYFDGAAKKADQIGGFAKEFVTFCQNYIYIPTIFMVVVCIIIAAFGNPQEKTGAKHKMLWVVFGIAALMSTMTIVSLMISLLSPDTASDLKI